MTEIKITIPYIPALSKNRRFIGKFNKVKSPDHAKAQDLIEMLFRRELINKPVIEKQKVWVSIMWYRKDMRGDLQNWVNPICDSIKRCLSFDDNYFAFDNLDWIVCKENPRMEISFKYQENLL